jgi:hypothetical protein
MLRFGLLTISWRTASFLAHPHKRRYNGLVHLILSPTRPVPLLGMAVIVNLHSAFQKKSLNHTELRFLMEVLAT